MFDIFHGTDIPHCWQCNIKYKLFLKNKSSRFHNYETDSKKSIGFHFKAYWQRTGFNVILKQHIISKYGHIYLLIFEIAVSLNSVFKNHRYFDIKPIHFLPTSVLKFYWTNIEFLPKSVKPISHVDIFVFKNTVFQSFFWWLIVYCFVGTILKF